jgi:hypothetical protein
MEITNVRGRKVISEVIILPEVVKIFSQINISVVFTHAFKIKSFTNICMWIITH